MFRETSQRRDKKGNNRIINTLTAMGGGEVWYFNL